MLSWLNIKSLQGIVQPSPLFGYCPPFDQNLFIKKIKDLLKVDLKHFESDWSMIPQQIAPAHSANVQRFSFLAAPLKGTFEIQIPKIQLQNTARAFLGHDAAISESLEHTFIDFFVGQFISTLCQTPPLQFIQPTPSAHNQQLTGDLLQGLLVFKFENFELSITVWIDQTLHANWIDYWKQRPSLIIDKELAQSVHLSLQLQLTQLELNAADLSHLQVGDWIQLDNLSADKVLKGAAVNLMLDKRKVAKAQLDENAARLKIINLDDFFDRLACS